MRTSTGTGTLEGKVRAMWLRHLLADTCDMERAQASAAAAVVAVTCLRSFVCHLFAVLQTPIAGTTISATSTRRQTT